MAEKDNILDTRKTGPLGYRALQMANQAGFTPSADALEYASKNLDYSYTPSSSISLENTAPERTYTPEQLGVGEDIGSSMFDPNVYNDETLANYQDVRAENQPTLAKWGAGITKGVSLAATTFIDGTLGFLYGIGRGIYGATVLGEDASTSFSRLFDNEISNALQNWNNYMEEALPNYQTDIEKNRAWYENLGTANFWADSFLKNMGFTVGAFYGGGAWTKALKAAHLLQTGTAAKIVGSTLSAVNEGRIEALNTERDFKKLNYQQLEDAYRPLFNQIMSEPDTLEQVGENTWRSSKQRKLKELKVRYDEEKAKIDERAANAGLITLAGNVPLLTLDNMMFMGRAYARGFKNARDLANGTAKQGTKKGFINAGEDILSEEATEGIVKQGAKYAFNTTSKKKAILKGLGISLNEGNEELAQAFVSDFAGNTQSYDSPDAYYLALTDPNAELKTKDMLTSVTEGFMNTYGNGDRWEEFAVGALTGIIGMPTFGKVNNSDANTYLGRGKAVGLTGGIFGEMSYASNRNKEGQANVDAMNAFVDKYQAQKRYFAQSQSFTDAMDGWSEANDAFEFKNAEDNDAFSAISRFARAGRLNDLKEMVGNSFDNLTDEDLADIAANTTPEVGSGNFDTGGWRNLDGSLMSDTEEGRDIMRDELGKKKETILSEIDNYQKSVEAVRTIGNNSLTEDQVNELAWLNWKIGRFNDRFGSIKNENEDLFNTISNDLLNFRDSIDEESEEGKKWLKIVNNYIDFVSYLQGSKSALDLANKIGDNKKLMEALASQDFYDLFTEHTSLDYSNYKNTMDNLIDAARLAKASKDFNTRYKEFVEDPIKLIQNREKIDKKKQKVNTTAKNIKDKDKIDNMSVADINNAVDNGDMSFDDIASILGTDDDFLNSITTDENGNPISKPIDEGDSTTKKVSEAKKKHDTASQITEELQTLADDGSITEEALNDALTLLNQSKSVSETEQEMLDTATEAYNNPDIIYNEDDPTIQQIQVNPEELASVLDNRLDSAKTAIEMAKAATKEKNDELKEITSTGQVTRTLGEEHLTGHDSVAKTESEQERKERLDKEQEQAAANKPVSMEEKVSKVLEGALQNADSGLVSTTSTQVGNILSAIDKLIESGADNKEIGSTIKGMTQYDEVKQVIPDLDNRLNKYVTEQRTPQAPKESKPVEEEQYTPTQSIAPAEIVASSRRESARDNSQGELPTYDYWKPTMTRHPIYRDKGNDTPYPVIARTLKKKDGVTPLYTEAQLKRMEAVDSYLRTDTNAYDRVDKGGVKVGDEIHFMVDSSLNEKAGDFVILMTDKNGNVLGDVMSTLDSRHQSQVGLPQFIERVKKEYELAGRPDKFISKEVSAVNKNMVGKVPYAADEEMHTLNEVHMNGSEQIPFKLGIALTGGQNAVIRAEAGRTKREGRSTMERTIQSPLSAVAGQPFLLMPTSSSQKAYVTVPITTPLFGQDLFDTSIGKSIRSVLGRVATSDNNNAINIIRDLQELIAIPEIHINYTNDNVKVTIKPQGATHQMTIYNGSKSSETLTDQLMLGLQGQPIQISRKYINDQYNGQDYNRMIGEIAQVNLPIGRTHTESDWFTINPIGVDGKQMKAKSPKNIGFNPNSSRSLSTRIPYGRNGIANIIMDTNTFEVFDDKGNVYNGADKTIMQAHGWGFITNQNLYKPYHSPWGWYDPTEGKFIEEPKSDNIVTRTLGEEEVKGGNSNTDNTQPKDTTVDYTETMRKAGLLGTKVRQDMWQQLTPEQQEKLGKKKGPQVKQWMQRLEVAYAHPESFPAKAAEILGTTLLRKEDGSTRQWNERTEMKWLSKVLPQFSNSDTLRVVKGLIEIADGDGYAYGRFKDGIIEIGSKAARGTLYHEAFHAVAHTLLSKNEFDYMINQAKEHYNTDNEIAAEEEIAESFRRYVQMEETPVIGSIVRLFRTLKHLVMNMVGKESYLDNLFYRINRGKLGNYAIQPTTSTRYNSATIANYQRRVDSLVNNPILNRTKFAKNNAWGKLRDYYESQGIIMKGYKDKNGNYRVASVKGDPTEYYRRVEQYHRDKLELGNLGQEDRNYITERGISESEYNSMSTLEKEVLFRCR